MQFEAVLETNAKTATGIEVPVTIVEALGAGKRPKVKVTLKRHTYRTTVAVMGGRYLIPVAAEVRVAAGVTAGETLTVGIDLDAEPREVDVPDDLTAALEKAGARAAFDKLSYSHRKEHVRAVEEAKKPETRQRRIDQCVAKVGG